MDAANLPNVEEAETKGDASSPRKRARRQGVVTRPKLACLGEREAAAALPRDDEHRTLRTNAHPCADSSNAKIVVDVHPNGGAKILHVYYDDLSPNEIESTTDEFFRILFAEEKSSKFADYVMGVVHNASTHVPELVSYFRHAHADVNIRVQSMTSKTLVESKRMREFAAVVEETYAARTYRGGALNEFSLIGKVSEEMGGYFPDIIRMLEASPFLRRVLPWGPLSALKLERPEESDDGPIMWARPGEQMLPPGSEESAKKRGRVGRSEVQSLSWRLRASQPREILFEDRTPCHADHVGHGPERCTTAAVGLLKAIYTEDRLFIIRLP
ncbi:lysine-specific demethylase RSBN1L-like isoform X1 [Oscarella lobularis]|uniref:lysine-specific demethylase RSBN1L-like isoform X1 n=1 Tax=Oscarella lobularis TaxID=121494 RepID=UPI003313611F